MIFKEREREREREREIYMVVKITIWIVGSHDFTIPHHQNV